jgi:hypothetical protein
VVSADLKVPKAEIYHPLWARVTVLVREAHLRLGFRVFHSNEILVNISSFEGVSTEGRSKEITIAFYNAMTFLYFCISLVTS